MTTQQTFELALQHLRAERLGEAEVLYRQVVAAQPGHADAWHHLGLVAHKVGRQELAIGCIRRALALRPDLATAHSNLGEILRVSGRLEEASAHLRRALEVRPDYAEALNNLGLVLNDQGLLNEAVAAFHRAIEIQPDYANAYSNLGLALTAANPVDELIALQQQAIEINPRHANAYNNLGVALVAAERHAEAIVPYRRAIELNPDMVDFHWNLAVLLLATGQLRDGWEEYEWRGRRPHLARPDLTAPPWNGEDLSGKTLLIHQEGGFGDVIHFMRYLPQVLARGAGRIIFEGGTAILPLMKMQPDIAATVERGRLLPPHDFQCPPQSFPRLFGTELHNIPAEIPYLITDPEKVAAWRGKASAWRTGDGNRRQFLVGLCWSGSDHYSTDKRSRTLATFAPLAEVPGVTFISLQKGSEAGQIASAPAGMHLVNAAAEVEDFSDLAPLVSCLDAVASVDTSVAHLAGALGIPVWILVQREADFRWLLGREDSPWYPTARLFRQREFHSWDEPMQRMAAELRARAS